MQRNDFLRAFAALGGRLSTLAEIVVAGGSALVLLGIVDRSTADADAVSSRPKLSTLPVTSPPSPTSWAWPRAGSTTASPPTAICSLTGLSIAHRDARYVRPAHRARAWPRGSDPHEDGGRPRDLDDLHVLAPTAEDVAFVDQQLSRINKVSPRDALRIQLYLEQHSPTPKRS
jgi:hypothetical protein